MTRQNCWSLASALVVALALGNSARATDPVPTTIAIADMHCGGCAKKIAARLSEVPGVATVQTDLEAKTAVVRPKAQTVLSPRALWEGVEKAGKQPIKLEGPSGKFTAKPQS